MTRTEFKEFLEKYWLALPVASSALLVLSYHPFNLWPLSFVALVPYFYLAYFSEKITVKKLFIGGFLFGFIDSMVFSYFSVMNFRWLPDTYLFVWAIKMIGVPVSAVVGIIFGSVLVFLRSVKRDGIADIFSMASAYTLLEWLFGQALLGYNLTKIGYSLHETPLMSMASVGGTAILSFIAALINAFVVFFLLWRNGLRSRPTFTKGILSLFAAAVLIASVYAVNYRYLNADGAEKSATFAVIEIPKGNQREFGYFSAGGKFSFPLLEKRISDAAKLKPDFLIYPFSFTGDMIPAEKNNSLLKGLGLPYGNDMSKISEWFAPLIPPGTVFVSWNDVVRDKVYGEVDFWNGGKIAASYSKRYIFPFIDYTPEFSKNIGLYTVPLDLSPGAEEQSAKIGDMDFSTLLCSEVANPYLARADASHTNVIISPGSEAIFSGNTMGNLDVIAAQFRAAETHHPLVRANRLGPSALIDANGNIIKRMEYGADGILYGSVSYGTKNRPTIYSVFGNWLPIGAISLFMMLITALKIGEKRRKVREV